MRSYWSYLHQTWTDYVPYDIHMLDRGLDTIFEPHYFRFLEEVKLSYLSHLYQIVRWLMHPMILNISNCIIVYYINKQEIT